MSQTRILVGPQGFMSGEATILLPYERSLSLLVSNLSGTRSKAPVPMRAPPEKGTSFLVQRIDDLREALAGARAPSPSAVSSSGAFLRAGRRGRRAG